jgi:hypothetical protein
MCVTARKYSEAEELIDPSGGMPVIGTAAARPETAAGTIATTAIPMTIPRPFTGRMV